MARQLTHATCAVCAFPLRSKLTKAPDAPGTRVHRGRGKCATCYDRTYRERRQLGTLKPDWDDREPFTPPTLNDPDPKIREWAHGLNEYLKHRRRRGIPHEGITP